jgi:hypothetical protein
MPPATSDIPFLVSWMWKQRIVPLYSDVYRNRRNIPWDKPCLVDCRRFSGTQEHGEKLTQSRKGTVHLQSFTTGRLPNKCLGKN